MAITAVIFDAFGTTLPIGTPIHPYRRLLREGARHGRRHTPGDLHKLMAIDAELREAVGILGIQVTPSRMAEIESDLQREIESIEVFQDACDAIALLHERGIATAVCSNLVAPYEPAVKKLLPDLNAYALSCELGFTKSDPAIYRTVCYDIGVVPGHLFGNSPQVALIRGSSRCDRDGCRTIGIKGFHLDRSGAGAFGNFMKFAKLVAEQFARELG
ncbi:HAD family hydrolase [Pseudomonas sp. UBA6562]|uniref:HAD family hydrolase n=1 Tax=Pseudomonas sp. UBA6562 TaxID=1947332 RepID=UPI0025ED3798|nr:HAD family hydrolase [Pseudomonas sp. UBA6562]